MSALGPRRSRRLVVGISGSSAPHYGIAAAPRASDASPASRPTSCCRAASHRTIELETDLKVGDVEALADVVHEPGDLAASISSGSFLTMGMIVAPCSMRTLASIAHGLEDNLLTRAADVTLKERRPLVLVPRETPLSLIHLRNMVAVTEAGATVLPPMPGFYHRPASIDDLHRPDDRQGARPVRHRAPPLPPLDAVRSSPSTARVAGPPRLPGEVPPAAPRGRARRGGAGLGRPGRHRARVGAGGTRPRAGRVVQRRRRPRRRW